MNDLNNNMNEGSPIEPLPFQPRPDAELPLYGSDIPGYAPTFPQDLEQPAKKKKKRRFGCGTLLLCMVLSLACGFGGAYAAIRMFGAGGTVIYESVPSEPLANATASSYAAVVEATKQSVVEIRTEETVTSTWVGQYVTSGAGSGVIISADGYVITNNHVVEGASNIVVITADGTEYRATLVGADARTDVAVVKVDAVNLPAAVLGDSTALRTGDAVVAIGNPLGHLGGTVTEGIISALDRDITINGQTMTLLQTSAAVSPGNSGGGLFNMNGELIGVVNAKSTGEDVEGLGFAIPINTAKEAAQSIIENGYVTGRAALGVMVLEVSSEAAAQQYGVNRLGVYITEVTEGMGAQKAGLMAGDYIVSVDGNAISVTAELLSFLDEHEVGDVIEMQIIRDGKIMTFDVELSESQPE